VEELQQQLRAGRKKKNKKKVNASSFSHVDSFPSHASSTWSRVNFPLAHSACLSSLLRARYPLRTSQFSGNPRLIACLSIKVTNAMCFVSETTKQIACSCLLSGQLCFSCREVHVWCLFPEDITGEDTALWKTYKELLSAREKTDIAQCSSNPKLQTEKLLARTLVRTTLARCNPKFFLMSLFCLRHCSICLLALLADRFSKQDSHNQILKANSQGFTVSELL
jgi:hypothetical protein